MSQPTIANGTSVDFTTLLPTGGDALCQRVRTACASILQDVRNADTYSAAQKACVDGLIDELELAVAARAAG